MRRRRFSEEQMLAVLKEHAAAEAAAAVCRRHGISEQTLDRGKAKRLKLLEDENARLKRLVADQALDNQALKELLRTNF